MEYIIFCLQEKEFKRSCSNIDRYHFFDNKAFVLWEWDWVEDDEVEDSISEASNVLSARSSPELISDYDAGHSPQALPDDTSEDDDAIPAITHSVLFKCIGADKERNYQEVLCSAAQKHGKGINVPVKLQPEPNNKYDNKAIAFMCETDSGWERIGYVVREATEEVQAAIRNKKIMEVKFEWIKYKFIFKSPAWYAAICITLNGEWSKTVMRSSASFN